MPDDVCIILVVIFSFYYFLITHVDRGEVVRAGFSVPTKAGRRFKISPGLGTIQKAFPLVEYLMLTLNHL